MADEKNVVEDQVEELDESFLSGVVGGGMRDDVVITPTTDISDDTRDKI